VKKNQFQKSTARPCFSYNVMLDKGNFVNMLYDGLRRTKTLPLPKDYHTISSVYVLYNDEVIRI
jgi:hypothetical protein